MPVVAIDLGGTKIAGALVSDTGVILKRANVQLDGSSGHEVGVLIRSVVTALMDNHINVTKAGISVPGIAHPGSGTVWAPNIPGWENYPLKSELESFFHEKGLNVVIESDRTCYILGERWKGAATGCNDAIYLSVGTGIGAGIITGGEILRGSAGIAGAVGWLALQNPFTDEYIKCGCFEYYASGAGIAANARKLLKERNLNDYFGKESDEVYSEDVFEAFFHNDPVALKVINKAIGMWGMAAANLVSIFDPEMIIFGGGVFGPAAGLIGEIKKEAEKWAQPVSIRKVKFVPSLLQGDAGIYGAGYIALK